MFDEKKNGNLINLDCLIMSFVLHLQYYFSFSRKLPLKVIFDLMRKKISYWKIVQLFLLGITQGYECRNDHELSTTSQLISTYMIDNIIMISLNRMLYNWRVTYTMLVHQFTDFTYVKREFESKWQIVFHVNKQSKRCLLLFSE